MKFKREFITPYVTFLAFILGVSGVFMFLHIFDNYTKIVHEVFGLIFVVFSSIHLWINWKGFKKLFKHKHFPLALFLTSALTIAFVTLNHFDPDKEAIVINKLFDAPVEQVLIALKLDKEKTLAKFSENGISVDVSKTLNDASKINNIPPQDILGIVID